MAEQSYRSDAELLARYGEGPAQLRAALADVDEAGLDLASGPGTWSIRQITHHIVDGDDLWKMCIKAALGNSEATFSLQWYWDLPQDTWVERWDYAGRALEPSLALFETNRRHTLQLLRHVPAALDKGIVIRWPGGQEQEFTVRWIVEMQARHTRGHIDDILAIRQSQQG